MALADWDQEGTGTQRFFIDSAVMRTGNSSLRNDSGLGSVLWIARSVSKINVRSTFWTRSAGSGGSDFSVAHTEYGTMDIARGDLPNTWRQWRVSFWYDEPNDTKWGRIEHRDSEGDAFTQLGSDTNFGAGAPVAGKFRMGNSAFNALNIDDQVVLSA